MKVKCDHRSKFKQLERSLKKKKKISASTGFEPVTSAIPVRCSTNWAMKPHTLFHISFTSFHCTGRYELNKLTSLPMCGFTAQLVGNNTCIAEIMGSYPVEALIFSGFFFPIAYIGKFTAMIILHFHSLLRPIKRYIRYIIHAFANWLNYHSLGYFNQGLSSDPLNNFLQFLWWARKFSQISQFP